MEYEDLQLNLRFSLIFLAALLAVFLVGVWVGDIVFVVEAEPERPKKTPPETPTK